MIPIGRVGEDSRTVTPIMFLHGAVRPGMAGHRGAPHATAGQRTAWQGKVLTSESHQRPHGWAWLGQAGYGVVRRGEVRHGATGHGQAWLGMARQGFFAFHEHAASSVARYGGACPGLVMRGAARLGKTRRGSVRPGMARQGSKDENRIESPRALGRGEAMLGNLLR